MSRYIQVTRMFRVCLAAGTFLVVTVQAQAQTAVPARSSDTTGAKPTGASRSLVTEIPAFNSAEKHHGSIYRWHLCASEMIQCD